MTLYMRLKRLSETLEIIATLAVSGFVYFMFLKYIVAPMAPIIMIGA